MSATLTMPSAPAGERGGGSMESEHLRRRAPARLEITDASGRPLRMTRRFIHVRAGQEVRVRVVPQGRTQDGGKPVASVKASESFYITVEEHKVPSGEVEAALVQFGARQRGKIPIPKRAILHITVTEPGHEAFTLNVPVAVWPSWWIPLTYGFLSVAGTVFANRFADLCKTHTPFEALQELVANVPLLITTAVLSGIMSVAVEMLGWLGVWTGWIIGDVE